MSGEAVKFQKCYGGVRFLDGAGPSQENVRRLDHNARPLFLKMMEGGIQVDLDHFATMKTLLTQDMERLTEEVASMTGHAINLDSGDQVSDLLFKKMGIRQARPKFTKSGDRESVENEVLVAIQHEHPVVSKLLEFKELSKLRGTYVEPMPRLARRVGPGHYRMFPKLGDTRVPSGRPNCKDPNLLAIPGRTKRGRQVREGFITRPGWVYLSVDESQIEPRVVAHRSDDETLKNIYFNKEDIYSDFATAAFERPDERYKDEKGWHYPTVDPDEHRRPSKTCVLAAIYDVTEVGLLEQMPIVCKNCKTMVSKHSPTCKRFQSLWTEEGCLRLIRAFYNRYEGIITMRKNDHKRARQKGYVWDDWGRILHTQGVRSSLEWVVSSVLRELGNFPIQSTAQGTVKLAMAEVYDILNDGHMFDVCRPLLTIHDELLFEVREDVAEDVAAMVCGVFENCVRLRVPITAGWGIAPSWGTLKK